MPYSVIIGDTRGVPSLSHVRPAAFLKRGRRGRGARFGTRAKLRKDIRAAAASPFYEEDPRARHVVVRVRVWMREFRVVCAGIYQDTRQSRERHYRGGALCARDSNLQGCANQKRARREINFLYIVYILFYSIKKNRENLHKNYETHNLL